VIPIALLLFLQEDDPELSNRLRRMELATQLETEVRALALPTDTTLIDLVNDSEYKPSIFISAEYNTTAEKEVFLEKMKNELISKGWIYYKKSKDRSFTTFDFCRGRFDAALSFNPGGILWGENSGKWKLFVGTGLRDRPLFGRDKIPESCVETQGSN
jgi:hypothetical protein